MEKRIIKGSLSDSQLLIGEDFRSFKNYLPDGQVIVLTDIQVNAFYGDAFAAYPMIEIGCGESVKTLETIQYILNKLVEYKADRSTFLLVAGGGIACDVGGFAASIFMRGIRFGFISTTLLSQVDASVGGKNGVNLGGYKNMVGTFNQPEFVICDPAMLQTLQPEDLNCGFAEIVKHTLIADAEMFNFFEKEAKKALQLDSDVIEKLILNSIEIKAAIVNKDEKEQGERRKLNLGHTFGHAAEKVLKIPHGNAVSLGLVVAARLSVSNGLLTIKELQRIINLLKMLNLPVEIPSKKEEILAALEMDKKKEGKQIHFVLMKGIGKVQTQSIDIEQLKKIDF